VIFLDTSAIYALADRADARHGEAVAHLDRLLQAGERLVTHNYVLVESLALLQHRLGTSSAVKLSESASGFEIIWVDRQLHEEAARRLARAGKRRVSFVDHVSFLVMKSRGIEKALAFDPDFSSEGFSLL
jgi:predicted nucleic acid-binding protein